LAPKIALTTPDWYGSLSVAFRDDTGYLFRRNRYYDPTQGQFTQSDPIGIAGGMNLYGYAGGDPINLSDPYGLNPCGVPPLMQACVGLAVAATGAVTHLLSTMLSDATSKEELTRDRPHRGPSIWQWIKVIGQVGGRVLGGLLGHEDEPTLLPPPPPAIEIPGSRPAPSGRDSIRGG
jgi:RHS repeat-associated protein